MNEFEEAMKDKEMRKALRNAFREEEGYSIIEDSIIEDISKDDILIEDNNQLCESQEIPIDFIENNLNKEDNIEEGKSDFVIVDDITIDECSDDEDEWIFVNN